MPICDDPDAYQALRVRVCGKTTPQQEAFAQRLNKLQETNPKAYENLSNDLSFAVTTGGPDSGNQATRNAFEEGLGRTARPKGCRSGHCTGIGCLVLFNERHAHETSAGNVFVGGISSDCATCIEDGVPCPNRSEAFYDADDDDDFVMDCKHEPVNDDKTPSPMGNIPYLSLYQLATAVNSIGRTLYQELGTTPQGQYVCHTLQEVFKDVEAAATYGERVMAYPDAVNLMHRMWAVESELLENGDNSSRRAGMLLRRACDALYAAMDTMVDRPTTQSPHFDTAMATDPSNIQQSVPEPETLGHPNPYQGPLRDIDYNIHAGTSLGSDLTPRDNAPLSAQPKSDHHNVE